MDDASDDLEFRVKRIIAKRLNANPNQLTHQTHIYRDLSADSLDEVEILAQLEHEFACPAADRNVHDDDISKLLMGTEKYTVRYYVKWARMLKSGL